MEEKDNVYKIEPMGDDTGELHTRKEGESLSEYLDGINNYINGINEQYGVHKEPEKTDDIVFSGKETVVESAPAEEPAPETVPEKEEVSFGVKSTATDLLPEDLYTEKYSERNDSPIEEIPENGSAEYDVPAGEEEPVANVGKIRRIFGDSRLSVLSGILNGVLYVIWIVAYVVCVYQREGLFSRYEARMLADGIASYHMEISTPFIGLLKAMLYIMPIIVILWTVAVVMADKKGKRPASKKTLIGLFGLDTVIGITVLVDIAYAGLLFT